MLIKITNMCAMGCTHCMEDSTPVGEHMTEVTFRKALDFTERAEALAWSRGAFRQVLLSGGECTEHPEILRFIEIVEERKLVPLLITNGMWLADDELRKAILKPQRSILVQVTNDTRFYPHKPPEVRDRRVVYVPRLTVLVPLGRAKGNETVASMGLRRAIAPPSFNLRSATRSRRSFEEAVAVLRMRATLGQSGNCTPSIMENGDVVAGETRFCWKIGTVESSMTEVTRALLDMEECNRCGLEAGLSQVEKRAIGLARLFGPGE